MLENSGPNNLLRRDGSGFDPRRTSERAVDQPVQFVCRASDSLVQIVRVLGDRQWGAALQAGLNQATFVVLARLLAVLVAQMNLDPRDVIAVPGQGVFDFACGPSRQCLVAFNVVVGIDLDLHDFFLCDEMAACLQKHIFRVIARTGGGGKKYRGAARYHGPLATNPAFHSMRPGLGRAVGAAARPYPGAAALHYTAIFPVDPIND